MRKFIALAANNIDNHIGVLGVFDCKKDAIEATNNDYLTLLEAEPDAEASFDEASGSGSVYIDGSNDYFYWGVEEIDV